MVYPIEFAVKSGNLDIVKTLVEKGCADVTKVSEWSLTRIAVDLKHYDILEYLVKVDPDINNFAKVCGYGFRDDNPLSHAISKNDFRSVKILVDNGMDVNTINHSCWDSEAGPEADFTQLMYHIFRGGDIKIFHYLIEHGADINRQNYKNESALSMAVLESNFEMAKYLLEKKVNVNSTTSNYYIDLDYVQRPLIFGCRDLRIFKLLEEHGACLNALTDDGKTLLHVMVERGLFSIVNYLKDKNNSPNESVLSCSKLL